MHFATAGTHWPEEAGRTLPLPLCVFVCVCVSVCTKRYAQDAASYLYNWQKVGQAKLLHEGHTHI